MSRVGFGELLRVVFLEICGLSCLDLAYVLASLSFRIFILEEAIKSFCSDASVAKTMDQRTCKAIQRILVRRDDRDERLIATNTRGMSLANDTFDRAVIPHSTFTLTNARSSFP